MGRSEYIPAARPIYCPACKQPRLTYVTDAHDAVGPGLVCCMYCLKVLVKPTK